jgi:hypothetical protein
MRIVDEHQQLEPAPAETAPTPEPEPAPASHDAPEPEQFEKNYQPGETEVFDNGAYITLVEIPGSGERKWAVYDSQDQLVGYRRQRATAVALAQRAPHGSLTAL